MFLFFSLIVLIAFVLYFYFLGLWFFALLPIVFLLIFLGYITSKTPLSFGKFSIGRYSLHIAWFLILSAIFGILSFLGIKFPMSILWIIVGNALLWIFSYIFAYDDGKKIFQFGYYLSLILFLIIGLFILPGSQLISFFLIILGFQFGFIGFLKFIVGLWFDVEDIFLYTLFISGLLLFCTLILSWLISLPVALSLISIVLMILYICLWWFVQKKPINRGRISVRRILAGERLTSKAFFSNIFLAKMYNFVLDMPMVFRYILEALNVLVVLLLFGSFVVNWSSMGGMNHLFYWIVISVFVGNVLLLKRIQYTSFFQNLFLFLVIHFAVYVSLFSYFESNIQSIVLWSVIWNIVTSLGLFVMPEKYKDFFDYKDYWYWIVASIMSFLVNFFLLLKSGLAGELIFFLLLLYVGIESMLLFYGIKHLGKNFNLDE